MLAGDAAWLTSLKTGLRSPKLAAVALSALLVGAAWCVPTPAGASTLPVALASASAQSAPRFELPFPVGARWVVLAPSGDRGPSRADAWSISFAPSDPTQAQVTAPAAGQVQVLDLRPPMLPIWCSPTAHWSGRQLEVQIRTADGSVVALTNVDALVVSPSEEVQLGQPIGRLGDGGCGGRPGLALVRWEWDEGRIVSRPFGVLSGLRDDVLMPGTVVTREAPGAAEPSSLERSYPVVTQASQ